MCGFVGVITTKGGHPLPLSLLDLGIQALATRGPDSVGYYEAAEADISYLWAHRRLKIIDLSDAANQPFQRDHLVMVFNGEIYNYLELKRELEDMGKTFTTSSDTEVLLSAYESWGADCFDKLEGAFSLVILNKKAQTVVLARDRFGEKPLYYLKDSGALYFASTLNAVTGIPGVGQRPRNLASMREFLVLGYASAPHTARMGIQKLKPGQVLTFSLPNLHVKDEYFGFQNASFVSRGSDPFDIEAFESLLVGSLAKRFRADLPVILLLSGGIDSTYLACLAKRVLNLNFRAITITDNLDDSSETRRAQQVCEILNIPHTLIRISYDQLNMRGRHYLAATDDISGDPAFPILCELFSSTPKDAVVFLTGDGADEMFLSYANYSRYLEKHCSMAGEMSWLRRVLLALAGWLPRPLFTRCIPLITRDAGTSLRLDLEAAFRCHGLAASIPADIAGLQNGIGGLYQYSIQHELPEYLLYKTDRASMMFSKEARAPYLDSALFGYMLSRNRDSAPLGNKNPVIARINHYLGCELGFQKRGMAAGGQRNYAVSIKDICAEAVLLSRDLSLMDQFKFFIQILTNPMARFRLLAISAWASNQ